MFISVALSLGSISSPQKDFNDLPPGTFRLGLIKAASRGVPHRILAVKEVMDATGAQVGSLEARMNAIADQELRLRLDLRGLGPC